MIEKALQRIDGYLCRYRTFPWQRNWAIFGDVFWQSQKVPWVPSLFLPALTTSNLVVDGDCETFSINNAVDPVAFGTFKMGFAEKEDLPASGFASSDNPKRAFQKFGVPDPSEKSSSLYARSLLEKLKGSPLSKFLQLHFLAMELGFSTFFYLDVSDAALFRHELVTEAFLKAVRDAVVKTTDTLDYSGPMVAITGTSPKQEDADAVNSIFGLDRK